LSWQNLSERFAELGDRGQCFPAGQLVVQGSQLSDDPSGSGLLGDGEGLRACGNCPVWFTTACVGSSGPGEVDAAVPAVLRRQVFDRLLEDGCGGGVLA
jgi:hypothetical protein